MTTTALSKPEIAATKFGRRLAGFGGLAAMLLAALSAMAQGTARQLEAIDVQSLPGQVLEIRLRLSDTPPEPMSFTIDNPARIALDLTDTTIGMDSRRQDVNQGPLATVLTAEAGGRTRVVFNMNNMVPYGTRVVGDSIYVTLGQQGTEPPASFAAQPASPAAPASSATAAAGRAINNIDFRRGRAGAGQIVVDLSNPRTTVDVREEGGRIIVDFQDTALPTDLMQRLDVTDFATPVATVDALRADSNA
ncbi:MAG: AMIN domain-containing protein, partial [Gammaproteobacteria bacterium]|nr:AMIN domain-containing protein [Gammaproteobacteria bacterium]